jgi:hypothetical protein
MLGEKTLTFGVVPGGARPQGTRLRFGSGRAPTQLRLKSQGMRVTHQRGARAASMNEGRAYITSVGVSLKLGPRLQSGDVLGVL